MGRRSKGKQQELKPRGLYNQTLAHSDKMIPLIDDLLKLCIESCVLNLDLQKKLTELIEKIQKLENGMEFPTLVDNRLDSAILNRFTEWMNSNGAKFDGIEIAEFAGYELGLKTNVDIDKSSLIISVPRNLMLTYDAAKKSELKNLIVDDMILSKMPNVALAVFLLLEKFKENSFWKPYIDTLPQTYSTILYFNVDDLKELHGSPILESSLRVIKSIIRQYAYFYKIFNTNDDPACKILRKHFTFNQYRWAVSTVMTRQNAVPLEDDSTKLINALIPLWDFCNHTSGSITTEYNTELKCCECMAIKDFKVGEQILIFYGVRNNPDLFIYNGFVFNDNEYDEYCLRLGLSKSDALKESRQLLLKKLNVPEQGEYWLKKCEVPFSRELLTFIRVYSMNSEQLNYWLNGDNDSNQLQDFEFVLVNELETKYWTFLANRLKLILSTYKTTMEDDLKLIEDKEGSSNKLLAIKMRLSEKRILNHVRDFALKKLTVA